MATPTTQADERRQHAEFARRFSEQDYRARLAPFYQWWNESNLQFFGERLQEPRIAAGRTAPRSLVHIRRLTDYGGELQITLNERLVFGTNRDWVQAPWRPEEGTAQGIGRFLKDLILRVIVLQHNLEERGNEERGYRGFGPLFTSEANRVGFVLRLTPVVVDHRRSGDEAQPLARGWPHCVRGRDYYGDDITETLWEVATGQHSTHRQQSPGPNLGIYEYFLALLGGGGQQLRMILTRQVDWLQRLRERRLPTMLRVEAGQLDVDGKTPLGEVSINPAWLAWNNGCVRKMAEAILAYRSFSDLPILADALEDAGCEDGRILRHVRAPIEHSARCWVLRALRESDLQAQG